MVFIGCIAWGMSFAACGVAGWEKDGVQVRVHVESSLYTYTLTNRAASPIIGFEVGQYHTYDYQTPPGWSWQTKAQRVNVIAQDASRAVLTGQSVELSMRVTSDGAVLGTTQAKVILANGRTVDFERMWAPQAPPFYDLYLVPAVLILIIIFHAYLVRRYRRDNIR